MIITGGTLIVNDTYGINCRNGNIIFKNINLSYGTKCKSLFRYKNHNINVTVEDSTINECGDDKSLTYNIYNYYHSPVAQSCGLYVRNVTFAGTFVNGNVIYYDCENTINPILFAQNNSTLPSGVHFGSHYPINNGNSTERPTGISKGFQYYDTTLNKPIWWTGTKWVDATGTEV